MRGVNDPSETRADDDVLSVHFGRSANCSSIGSVVDVLFVSGVVGTAMLASVAVLLGGAREADADADPDAGATPEARGDAHRATSGDVANDAAARGRDGDAPP